MAWLRAVCLRSLLFCGSLFVWLVLGSEVEVDGVKWLRGSLLLSAALTLWFEWWVLDQRLDRFDESFKTYGQKAPPRWERVSHSGRWFGLFVVVLLPLQCVRAQGATDPWATVLSGTFMLACICALWWTSVTGGLTWLRYRLKGRLLPREAQPAGSAPAPLTTALAMAPVLLFGIWGTTGVAASAGIVNALTTAGEQRVELLVELGPDDEPGDIRNTVLAFGATVEPAFPRIDASEDADLAQTLLVSAPESRSLPLLAFLAAQTHHVDHIELNSAVQLGELDRAEPCTPSSRLPVWREYAPNPSVIGVVDTGVNASHPGLSGVVETAGTDARGHGTQVAGLAAGPWTSVNAGGTAVRVRSYPALASPHAAVDDVVQAIDDAIDDGVDVINLSFGAVGEPPQALVHAVEYANDEGVLVVAAAGNRGPWGRASEQWPANVPGVLVVGATTDWGQELESSSRLDGVANSVLVAGQGLCTTTGASSYVRVTGTSFAAARFSGLYGALKARRCLGPDQVDEIRAGVVDADAVLASCR